MSKSSWSFAMALIGTQVVKIRSSQVQASPSGALRSRQPSESLLPATPNDELPKDGSSRFTSCARYEGRSEGWTSVSAENFASCHIELAKIHM